MYSLEMPETGFVSHWRDCARALLGAGVPPEAVAWRHAAQEPALFEAACAGDLPAARTDWRAPARFIDLCEAVLCHRSPHRFHRLYEAAWRLQSAPDLMSDPADPSMRRLQVMAKSVRRDCHKMTAFLRFREARSVSAGRRLFYAWFEPDHFIVERIAPFFVRRFGDMDWTIATPDSCVHFLGGEIRFSAGESGSRPLEDGTQDLWATYYANIFNPARLKVKAMQAEMPKKYWKNLPETALIPGLVAQAEERVRSMRDRPATEPPVRARKVQARAAERRPAGDGCGLAPSDIDVVRKQISGCTRCALYCNATQAVFGEGPPRAAVMLVGEQPGDREDLAGRPFVGPAGRLLARHMADAGLDRSRCYLTNAVKHFKFQTRGKRRLHQRPNAGEIERCRIWLEQEIALVKPQLIVALGASAARSLTGNGSSIATRRGGVEKSLSGLPVLITYHPSLLLRLTDDAARRSAEDDLQRDLQRASGLAGIDGGSAAGTASRPVSGQPLI